MVLVECEMLVIRSEEDVLGLVQVTLGFKREIWAKGLNQGSIHIHIRRKENGREKKSWSDPGKHGQCPQKNKGPWKEIHVRQERMGVCSSRKEGLSQATGGPVECGLEFMH